MPPARRSQMLSPGELGAASTATGEMFGCRGCGRCASASRARMAAVNCLCAASRSHRGPAAEAPTSSNRLKRRAPILVSQSALGPCQARVIVGGDGCCTLQGCVRGFSCGAGPIVVLAPGGACHSRGGTDIFSECASHVALLLSLLGLFPFDGGRGPLRRVRLRLKWRNCVVGAIAAACLFPRAERLCGLTLSLGILPDTRIRLADAR